MIPEYLYIAASPRKVEKLIKKGVPVGTPMDSTETDACNRARKWCRNPFILRIPTYGGERGTEFIMAKRDRWKSNSIVHWFDSNIVDLPAYRNSRKHVDSFCVEKNLKATDDMGKSPSGRFSLLINNYSTKKGCWNYTEGVVKKGDQVLARIPRNYGSFPYLWVDHPNGNEYLVCGEDYQGYTIVNVTNGRIVGPIVVGDVVNLNGRLYPKELLEKEVTKLFPYMASISTCIPSGWLHGVGFCWVSHKFNREELKLEVEGCYWAFPFETVTYDFSDPDTLPLKELGRCDLEEEDDEDEDD